MANLELIAVGVAAVVLAGAGARTSEGKAQTRQATARAKRAVAAVAPRVVPKTPAPTKPVQTGTSGGWQPTPQVPIPAGKTFLLPAQLEPWRKAIQSASDRYAIRPTLLAAISVQESRNSNPMDTRFEPGYLREYVTGKPIEKAARAKGWKPEDLATSRGLMQVMGGTAWMYGFRRPVAQLHSATLSFEYGAKHLRAMMDKYLKDPKTKSQAEFLALVAYNGGTGAVAASGNGTQAHPSVDYARDVVKREQAILKGLDPRSV